MKGYSVQVMDLHAHSTHCWRIVKSSLIEVEIKHILIRDNFCDELNNYKISYSITNPRKCLRKYSHEKLREVN